MEWDQAVMTTAVDVRRVRASDETGEPGRLLDAALRVTPDPYGHSCPRFLTVLAPPFCALGLLLVLREGAHMHFPGVLR